MTRCEPIRTRSDGTAEHDETAVIAALEELEARRTAIEWLLAANLLGLCTV